MKTKKLPASALRVRVYTVLSGAVETAAAHIARRIRDDYQRRPTVEQIKEIVYVEVTNAIAEKFDFEGS
jgi:hypothetical protein